MPLRTASTTLRRASTLDSISSSLQMNWFRRSLLRSCQPTWPSWPRSRQYTTTSHDDIIRQDCQVEEFYKYHGGRWLWNEKYHLARRYIEFDVPGLLQVSAQAIGARSCVEVEKLPEGNFSKVFLITMDDGRELISKLPTQMLEGRILRRLVKSLLWIMYKLPDLLCILDNY